MRVTLLAFPPQGILAMERTDLGAVRLDPPRVLEDGIRRELVLKIVDSVNRQYEIVNSAAARQAFAAGGPHPIVMFLKGTSDTLRCVQRSFEYIQVSVYGRGRRPPNASYRPHRPTTTRRTTFTSTGCVFGKRSSRG